MTGVEAALASGLLNVAGNKLGSLISSEFAAITGVKKDLLDLQDIHIEVTSWLSAVGDRAIERDPSLRWVMKLRNLANDIYYLLDEVCLEDEKHKIHNDRKRHVFSDLFAKPKLLMFRGKVSHKIKAIKVTFDAIVKQRSNANTILHSFQVDQPIHHRNDKATGEQSLLSNAQESTIPSRDHLKTEIISKLLEYNNGEDGHIISIVGLGGSGKTTLARHICHDDKIKQHFKDSVFWVHVSQEFCGEKLIAKLFEAIIEQKSDLHAQQHMLHAISNKLSGKKFLLVLDDAWHEDRHDWENFTVHVNNGASGSKILLTTRNENVAKAVESKLVFNLPFLSEDESWSFFLKSSGWKEEDLDSDFITAGKDIIKKCGGVPLAIKTLGSVLQEKRRINTWRAIKESNLWDEEHIEGRVFVSLKLSYVHLKDHLKLCFTFCSIFPKGYRINKDYLIEQWIAHGFVKWKKEEQPEDIGSDYFNSLVKGGFLQLAPETEPNEIRRECWMHDLINDLAQYILQNEAVTSLSENITKDCARQCRYLSLTSLNEDVERGFEKLRALYVAERNQSFRNLVKKSGHIRSVVLDYKFDTPFPSFILRLQYLGYLEIHHASFTKFPEAISDCWNLQSLHFIQCNGFVTLPESIGKLRKLKILELKWITDLESLPQCIGNCGDLQSLILIWCMKLSEIPLSISKIQNLRGLHIVDCNSLEQHNFKSIGEFSNLQTINLSGCTQFQALPSNSLCHMLHTLDLSSTNITMLPQWVTTTSTLECIDLENCRNLLELPKGICNLKRLTVLNLKGCIKLHTMPSGLGQLTCLRKLGLFVVGCGEDDASISELQNLDKLSGHLEIRNLKYLKDPADAGKPYLKHMSSIQSMVLDWSLGETEEELLCDMEQVWTDMEPPSQIKDMKINGYQGSYLPRWMMAQNNSSFSKAILLKQTGPCQFLSLTELRVENCPNLKQMFGLCQLPSLKSLFLLQMANLEELWTITSDFENSEKEIVRGQCCYPSLSNISISGCPRLKVKPYFPPSLKKLDLCKTNMHLLSPASFSEMLPPPIDESSSSYTMRSAVSHLKNLILSDMIMGSSSGWESLQHHTELETLCIFGCNEMTQLPESIRSLTNLRDLRISRCFRLVLLPDWLGELRSLQSLYIQRTPMMQSLPESIKHLRSLVLLQIIDNNLKQLPDVIQHLTSLESLNLMDLSALTELPEWIGQLSALRRLSIQHCPSLECLPQSIQRLTALQYLNITNCPGLERRYKRGVGPDWRLISHILHVTIW